MTAIYIIWFNFLLCVHIHIKSSYCYNIVCMVFWCLFDLVLVIHLLCIPHEELKVSSLSVLFYMLQGWSHVTNKYSSHIYPRGTFLSAFLGVSTWAAVMAGPPSKLFLYREMMLILLDHSPSYNLKYPQFLD